MTVKFDDWLTDIASRCGCDKNNRIVTLRIKNEIYTAYMETSPGIAKVNRLLFRTPDRN
jgi:hypothetical protein